MSELNSLTDENGILISGKTLRKNKGSHKSHKI
ncbi:hypothetical protein T4B_11781 [Trichinella pseudospiralis]|uniref:Uncharacterized protein n=1 Tax=Trichinella pseudospiralis TaxID=6337 RepID=A0A0V1GGC7_TRIPS|nr:hypothetical protein T4B_11781 [Trichinella pseudospiralis]